MVPFLKRFEKTFAFLIVALKKIQIIICKIRAFVQIVEFTHMQRYSPAHGLILDS